MGHLGLRRCCTTCPSQYFNSSSPAPSASSSAPLAPTDVLMGGHFFGRFDAPNYPAVPYPTHPAPPQLVMPDFSLPEGGRGAGQSASDKTYTLAVVEEWDGCDASVRVPPVLPASRSRIP